MTLTPQTALSYCTYCPKMCRHACPVAEASGKESLTPQSKVASLDSLLRGEQKWTPETSESLWGCTGCGHCTRYCAHGNQPADLLFAGRQIAHEQDSLGPAKTLSSTFRADQPALSARAKQIFSELRHATPRTPAFWPSCHAARGNPPEDAATTMLLDGRAPLGLAVTQSICAGYPLIAAGDMGAFQEHAIRVTAELSPYDKVVTDCSACVHVFRRFYSSKSNQKPLTVLHTTEYWHELLEHFPVLEASKKTDAYYHDPCYLARHEQILDAPRELLARVANVLEFAWSGLDSECCGAGGALPDTMPEVANSMAKRRLHEVEQRGGGTVVTACSMCHAHLAKNAPANVRVENLTTFLGKVLAKAHAQQ